MNHSSSCIRCGSLIAAETPAGLCPTCVISAVVDADPQRTNLEARTESIVGGNAATAMLGQDQIVKIAPPMPPGYQFRGHLGLGGMGIVVRAYEFAGDREVALKLIRTKTDEPARKRFCVEAQSLARLKHPNVVQVFSVEVDSPDPFFTMEIVEGPTLDKVLKAGPLPIAEAVRLVAGAARGIAAAHASGVVHRDVKPSNILLSPDGTPKVTDFGLAKRTDRRDQLTVPEAMLGTPSFMAPEQAGRRQNEIGPRSDVYSLGATLYALLTGEPPFHSEDPVVTAALVLTVAPRPLRELRPEIPESLEAIVLKTLEKAPSDRHASATALAEVLERWQPGPPPGAARRVWNAVRQPSRYAMTAVAALFAAIGLTVFATAARPLAERPVAPPTRTNGVLTAEEVRDDLKSGKKVALVDAKGLRTTTEWAVGSGELRPPKANDVAFSFLANDYAVLILTADPGVDSYRIRAELRQDESVGDTNPKRSAFSGVGLVVGYSIPAVVQNQTVHTLETVGFNEAIPPGAAIGKRMRHDTEILLATPLRSLHTLRHSGPGMPLAPNAANGKREWKTIEVDVSPTGLVVRHNGTVVESSTADIDRRRFAFGEQLRYNLPNYANFVDRRWHPRTAVGLFAMTSWLSVRNLTIEPLPPNP